jgi:transcriptional antiterminator
MPFEERFQLLIASGQATERSVATTRSAIEQIEEYYGIEFDDELGASLASHLAITIKRLLAGETLVSAPDVVWQELQDHPEERALAEAVVAEMAKNLGISIAQDEVGFVALHLCHIRTRLDPDRRA